MHWAVNVPPVISLILTGFRQIKNILGGSPNTRINHWQFISIDKPFFIIPIIPQYIPCYSCSWGCPQMIQMI